MYPFSMQGRMIAVNRFRITYQQEKPSGTAQEGYPIDLEECVEYRPTRERAEIVAQRTGGAVEELDSSSYEWIDGVVVPDGPDAFAEAKKIYDLGESVWLSWEQAQKQAENNAALAAFLASHPLKWQDGKEYGITKEDQDDMVRNFSQYQIKTSMGLDAILEWHSPHEACRPFTEEEFCALAAAISDRVYPLVQKNQEYKTQIYSATSPKQLAEVTFAYEETD